MSKPDRAAMLDRDHLQLSLRRQCVLLGLARSGIYRPSKAANDDDLAVMRRVDELFLAYPFLGSRRIAAMLRAEGELISRKRVQRLMRLMGIVALGPKPRTSQPAPRHKVYPYLHRRLDDLLQYEETSSGAGQSDPDGGMAGQCHRRLAGQRCGHDAALGRR